MPLSITTDHAELRLRVSATVTGADPIQFRDGALDDAPLWSLRVEAVRATYQRASVGLDADDVDGEWTPTGVELSGAMRADRWQVDADDVTVRRWFAPDDPRLPEWLVTYVDGMTPDDDDQAGGA